jgi:hypothetical protein
MRFTVGPPNADQTSRLTSDNDIVDGSFAATAGLQTPAVTSSSSSVRTGPW